MVLTERKSELGTGEEIGQLGGCTVSYMYVDQFLPPLPCGLNVSKNECRMYNVTYLVEVIHTCHIYMFNHQYQFSVCSIGCRCKC